MILQEPRDDVTLEEDLRDLLAERGVPEPYPSRWAPLLLTPRVLGLPPQDPVPDPGLLDSHEMAATYLADAYRSNEGHADAAILEFLSILMGWARRHIFRDRVLCKLYPSTAGVFFDAVDSLQLDIDFESALRALRQRGDEPEPEFWFRREQLAGLLVKWKRVDPARMIDPNALRGEWPIAREYRILSGDPAAPEFWLRSLGMEGLATSLPLWTSEPSESLGDFALNFAEAVRNWKPPYPKPGEVPRPATREDVEEPFASFTRILYQAWKNRRSDLRLTEALYYYSCVASRRIASPEDAGMIADLRESARETLGRLRKLLGRADSAEAEDEFLELRPVLERAVEVLVSFASLWKATRVLLLALRALAVPAVDSGLRYWHEKHEDEEDRPPDPWRWVPDKLARILHAHLSEVQEEDPELEHFRGEFATLCLSRLRTRSDESRQEETSQDDPDMVEGSPTWRKCYIRTLRELKVNPGGKGHHVLHWSRRHDPDDEVRENARVAYKELRHGASLPPGVSPRRAVFAAFWWLRQAHRLALGEDVHSSKAQRTRRKEIRRTQVSEESDKST